MNSMKQHLTRNWPCDKTTWRVSVSTWQRRRQREHFTWCRSVASCFLVMRLMKSRLGNTQWKWLVKSKNTSFIYTTRQTLTLINAVQNYLKFTKHKLKKILAWL